MQRLSVPLAASAALLFLPALFWATIAARIAGVAVPFEFEKAVEVVAALVCPLASAALGLSAYVGGGSKPYAILFTSLGLVLASGAVVAAFARRS
jgi:hypothetical protein